MKNNILFLCLLICGTVFINGCSKEDDDNNNSNNNNNNNNNTNQRVTFEKTHGSSGEDETGSFVVQTSDGGYLVTGDSLRKFNASGTLVFTKPIEANSIMPTSDGNYILARIYSGNYSKIDASGNILWTQSFSGSLNFIYEISGGFVGCGYETVIKTDASGNIIWTTQIGTSGLNDNFRASEVRQTTDGAFVVVGTQVTGLGYDSQCTVYKLDDSGTVLWVKYFGGTSYSDEGYSIKATSDGGCVAAGLAGTGFFDMRFVKLDASGNTTWSKTYGDSESSESASHVAATSDGGYILVGTTDLDGNDDTYDVFVVKTNASGDQTWSDNFGGSQEDFAACVLQTSDGGYIITGQGNYTGSSSKGDVYLLKLKN